jgi:hypothetical protein
MWRLKDPEQPGKTTAPVLFEGFCRLRRKSEHYGRVALNLITECQKNALQMLLPTDRGAIKSR